MPKKQLGATLLELLISLTASLILLGLLWAIFFNLERNHQRQSELIRLKANALLVLKVLSGEIQKAGFIGCPYFSVDFPFKNSTSLAFSPQDTLQFSRDTLSVRYRSLIHGYLEKAMQEKSQLWVSGEIKFSAGDFLLLSDCRHADLFQVEKVHRLGLIQELTSVHPLSELYAAGAELGKVEINSYWVEKTNRMDKEGQAIWALYLRELNNNKIEFISGVKEISFQAQKPELGLNLAIKLQEGLLTKTVYSYLALEKNLHV